MQLLFIIFLTSYRYIDELLNYLYRMQNDKTKPLFQVYGECVPGVDYSPGPPVVGVVAMITELGRPVNVIEVLQMNFEDRLQVSYVTPFRKK